MMKSKSYWLVGALLALCLFALTGSGQSPRPTNPAWEYKIVVAGMSEAEMSKLGAERWELVQYDSGARGNYGNSAERYIFKRPK